MSNSELETLAWGYGLVEGPRIDAENRLYFSDAKLGGVYRRDPDGRIETVIPKRRGVGGIALHADGGLVVSGRDVSHVRAGVTRSLFARDGIPGFNDLCCDGAGNLLTMSRWDDMTQQLETVAYITNGANQIACIDADQSGLCDNGEFEYVYDAYGNLTDDGTSTYSKWGIIFLE